MGLFSQMLEDERILKALEPYEKILIVSCPGCACESLSYTEDLPNRRIEQLADMDANAVAVNIVRGQWVERLASLGKQVNYVSVVFPCEMFDSEREKIFEALGDHQVIAVLACSSAWLGIRDMLEGITLPIVPMMKTSGSFVFKLVKDETGEFSKVDIASARINTFAKGVTND